MHTDADLLSPLETGGMLLGYIGEPPRIEAVTRDVIGAGPRAVHRRGSFVPDGRWQQERLDAAYREDPTNTFLGDWHSHPGGGPTPSDRDLRTARRVARSRQARSKHPLTLILWRHRSTDEWALIGFAYDRGRLVEIEVAEYESRPGAPD